MSAPAVAAVRCAFHYTLLGAVLLAAPACKQDPMTEQPRTRLTEIAAAPTQFEGSQAVVTGVVRYKYADNLYVIGPEGNWPRADQRVLVVATVKPEGGAAEVYEGNRVRMLGTVQTVDRKTFAQTFPAAAGTAQQLGDDFFREWQGKPAITAIEIHILPRIKHPTTKPTTGPAPVTA